MIRVATYNIRKAFGLDWRRDPERILRVLEEISADIVVLQEADKRLGARAGVLPAAQLDSLGYALADASLRPESHGWHGNVILYRKPALELGATRRIALPSLEPRGAVAARFHAPRLEVIGVHLALNSAMRKRQLAALDQDLQSVPHPVLVAGDFNEWRKDPQAQGLGSDFDIVTPGPSFHTSRPVASLDRFALRGPIRKLDSHVHHSALAAKASDHLPVVLDMTLEGDEA